MSDEPVTVKVNLTPAAYEDLERCAYAEANTRTDVINRAIGVYAGLGSARRGEIVSFKDRGGLWRRVLVLDDGIERPGWLRRLRRRWSS